MLVGNGCKWWFKVVVVGSACRFYFNLVVVVVNCGAVFRVWLLMRSAVGEVVLGGSCRWLLYNVVVIGGG